MGCSWRDFDEKVAGKSDGSINLRSPRGVGLPWQASSRYLACSASTSISSARPRFDFTWGDESGMADSLLPDRHHSVRFVHAVTAKKMEGVSDSRLLILPLNGPK